MTRISKYPLMAAGLLAAAVTSAALAQQQSSGADRYAQTLAEAEITARYNTQIEQQLRSQKGEIAALEQQIAGLEATASQVEPLLQKMFTQLQDFVKGDIPFFAAERAARLQKLSDLMARVDASPSERARRRYQELKAAGRQMDLQTTLREIEERDKRDSEREREMKDEARAGLARKRKE